MTAATSTPWILVLEHDSAEAARLERVLQAAGFSVERARTEAEALDCLRSFRFELLLFDGERPALDLAAFQQQLLSLPATAAVPLVAIVSRAAARETQDALRARVQKVVLREELERCGDVLRGCLSGSARSVAS